MLMPLTWVPRDRYAAEAIKAAHYRQGVPYDPFEPGTLIAAGTDRNLLTERWDRDKVSGVPSETFLRWALLEDKRMREEKGGGTDGVPLWFPPAVQEKHQSRLAELLKEAEEGEAKLVELNARSIGGGGGSPEAVTKPSPVLQVLQWGSSDEEGEEEEEDEPPPAKKAKVGKPKDDEESAEEEEEEEGE